MAIGRPEEGGDEQRSENDGKTDQSRCNLSFAHDRKLSGTACSPGKGTTASSPPPAGTQIWPAMMYGTTRHSLQRVGCRIRVVTW